MTLKLKYKYFVNNQNNISFENCFLREKDLERIEERDYSLFINENLNYHY